MARNEEPLELLVSLGDDDIHKLQQGQKIRIGVISFVNEPIIITLHAEAEQIQVRAARRIKPGNSFRL
jgi:hypothetical protein